MANNSFEQDNIIQWIFEKTFDQLTSQGMALFVLPFCKIKERTFDNTTLHQLINKLTCRPLDRVQKYLSNISFLEKFLFSKIKNKLYVQIILGNLDHVKYLINIGYKINYKCLQLMSLNNRLEILKYVVGSSDSTVDSTVDSTLDSTLDKLDLKLDNELLMYCSEFGYEKMYFYLKSEGFDV